MSDSRSILFVCMGNICRSPAAEAVFGEYAVENNKTHTIEVDSAGTHDYHIGKQADPRMREAVSSRGFEMFSCARQAHENDLFTFDLVLAMDRENLLIVEALDDGIEEERRAQVNLFSHYLDDSWPTDVPDPYYGGADGFEYVLDMIEAGCPAILTALMETQEADDGLES